MKKTTYLSISLLFIIISKIYAGNYGIFFYGYGGDQASWSSTGTPTALVNEGILSDTDIPLLPPADQLDEDHLQTYLAPYLLAHSEDKWIIIGHSLGGLVARSVEPPIKQYCESSGGDVKGILTLGSPFQGAPVADAIGSQAAQDLVDNFTSDVSAGPLFQSQWGWATLMMDMDLSLYDLVIMGGTEALYTKVAHKLDETYNWLTGEIDNAMDHDAALYLGVEHRNDPDSYIKKVNEIETTTPHLSISGVEGWPQAIRFGSNFGDDLGDEDQAAQLFESTKTFFTFMTTWHKTLRDLFELQAGIAAVELIFGCIPCGGHALYSIAQAAYHNNGWIAWKKGRNALSQVDTRWAQVHKMHEHYERSYTWESWVGCPGYFPREALDVEEIENLFSVEPGHDPCDDNIPGYYRTFTYTYSIDYPDMSDGFIPVNRTRWNFGDPEVPHGDLTSSPDGVVSGNIYFDGSGEQDGGYNHIELKRLTRDYGQEGAATPMNYGKGWIRERLDLQ